MKEKEKELAESGDHKIRERDMKKRLVILLLY
jgi:hypothetical protein